MITVIEHQNSAVNATLHNDQSISGDPIFGQYLSLIYENAEFGPADGDPHAAFAEYLKVNYPDMIVERLVPYPASKKPVIN